MPSTLSGRAESSFSSSFLVLLYLTAFAFGLSHWGIVPGDHDLGWHLFGGSYVLTQHAVPIADPVNSFNSQWHDYHWLVQIIAFKIFQSGGYQALQICLGLLSGCFYAFVAWSAVKLASPRIPALALVILIAGALFLLHEVTTLRPHVITLFILSISQHVLCSAKSRFELPLLFVFCVLLVNMHVYWVFVVFLWGAYRCGPRLMGRQDYSAGYAWGGLLLLSLAGFVSPYGMLCSDCSFPDRFRNYFLLLEYMHTPQVLRESVGELRGGFAESNAETFVFFVYMVILSRAFRVGPALVRSGMTLSAYVSFTLIFFMRKYAGVFGILGLPFLVRERRVWRLCRRMQVSQTVLTRLLGVCLAGMLVIVWRTIPDAQAGAAHLEQMYPMAACRKIVELNPPALPSRGHLRVLTHFNFGGWCRWAMHQANPSVDARVTTDNRTQWVPGEHYEMTSRIFLTGVGWRKVLESWDPDFLVLPNLQPVTERISAETSVWALEYQDRRTKLFRRIRPGDAGPKSTL